MKKIELKKLVLQNYRNIDFASYDFNGSAKIVGENRIGKTNTLEAIYWLLTDYLLDGSSDMAQLKPLDDTTKVVSAEGTFDIDGYVLTIKKEFREKWVKTRGSDTKVMQGHETIYYINDVKQGTIKAYNKEIEAQFGLDLSKVKANVDIKRTLIDPYYLGDMGESLAWKDFRSFIIDIVGDVSDADVFAKNDKLHIIKEDLAKQNGRVDQAKKYVQQQILSLKQQIMIAEGNIETQSKVSKPTDEEIAIAKKAIDEHETNIAKLRASNGSDEASSQINEKLVSIRSDINDVKEKILKEPNPVQIKFDELDNEIRNYQSQIDSLLDKKRDLVNQKIDEERAVKLVENKIEDCSKKRDSLIVELKKIDAEIEDTPEKAIKECPYCHRPYEESKIVETVNGIIDKLNEKKKSLIEEGKSNNLTKQGHVADLDVKKESLEVTLNSLHNIEGDIVQINTKMEVAKVKQSELDIASGTADSPLREELKELMAKRDQLEKDLEQSRLDFYQGKQDINSQIYEEQKALEPYKSVIADKDFYDRTQIEIGKKREELQALERELGLNEQKFDAFNQFIRVKLEMLDSNVAKTFGNIKFQLIKENINGGYDAVCKPYIYDAINDKSTDVIWKSGSRSEKIATGVAILSKIREALEMPNLPILFDQGGEVSTNSFELIFPNDVQLICVQVQDGITKPLVINLE